MTNAAPSLDEFLRLRGLRLASFDGMDTNAALRLAGLHDRALADLGDAHRERSLVVRGALLDRLARKKKPAADDEDAEEGDSIPEREPAPGGMTGGVHVADLRQCSLDASRFAAAIISAGYKRRGTVPSPPSAGALKYAKDIRIAADETALYWARVEASARCIIAAGKLRRDGKL